MNSAKSREKHRYLFVSIVLFLFLSFLPKLGGDNVDVSIEWSLEVFAFSMVVLAFQLFTVRWFNPRSIILFNVFIILSYLFNLSQVFLYGFEYELADNLAWSSVFKTDVVSDATVLALQSIICVFWGGVTYFVFFNNKKNKRIVDSAPPSRLFIAVIFVIGFLCDFLSSVYVPLTVGYGDVEGSHGGYVLRTLGFFFYAAIALLLTDQKLSKSTRRGILYFFIGYKLICMLTGYRAFSLINIFLAIYIYHKTVEEIKISFKTVVLTVLVIVLGSTYLVMIRNTRTTGVDLSVMNSGMSGNPILDIISEFGITLNIVIITLNEMGGEGTGGGQLLTSCISFIPFIRSIFTNIDFEALTMDEALGLRNVGGSYIGDLLFDFGKDGMVPSSFIFGFILAFVFEVFLKAMENKKYLLVAYLFPILVDLIFCIRSSLAKMPREIVWFYILLYLFYAIFSGNSKKTLYKLQ